MSIGERIKAIRMDRGMLQKALADKVGVTAGAICQYERNIKKPSLQVGYEIAKALECNVAELVAEG